MVTLSEIAKAVGVSSSTVSRVLNYDQTLSISESKRQAIIETAEALNYETPRNRNRRTLAFEPFSPSLPGSTSIAILHFLKPDEELSDPYYVGVRLGIERRCHDHKLEIAKIFNGDELRDSSVLQAAVGMIVIGKLHPSMIDELTQTGKPVIFADFNPQLDAFDCVLSDLGKATRAILDGLESAGYQRIGFIGGYELLDDQAVMYGEQRCKAYVEWHERRNAFDASLIALGQAETYARNLRLETGYEQARQLLSLHKRPDAILCANDNMAIGAYRALQEAGVAIAHDIAVISFNDIPVTQFLNPPLSTMHIPGEPIGETAVDLLVERLLGRDYTKHVTIPTQMRWRDSCRRPPTAE